MASASAVGSGKRCSTSSVAGVPARAKARSRSRCRCAREAARPACAQLLGQGSGQPMEDESERLEILGGWLDGQGEGETFGRPARPERLELLAAGAGVDPRALLPEPGDERRPGEVGDRPDPAQAEPGEPRPHVGVGREQAGRMRCEEVGLATGRDDDRATRPGPHGGDRRREPGPGDPGPDVRTWRLTEGAPERLDQPLDEDRLRPPQRLRDHRPGPRTGRMRRRSGRRCRRSPD